MSSPEEPDETNKNLPPTEGQFPYAGSSGWSGSSTSKAAADYADSSGLTAKRQKEVYGQVASAGPDGATSREIEIKTGEGHGRVSGALSVLQKKGYLTRLAKPDTEPREGYQPYVLPQYVNGRATEGYNANKKP